MKKMKKYAFFKYFIKNRVFADGGGAPRFGDGDGDGDA